MNPNEMIDIDLPQLKSIKLGLGSLCGIIDIYSCLLVMRSMIGMVRYE